MSTSSPHATPSQQADLQVSGVSKRFGTFEAVRDLSFTVQRGSFFSILGPSGCGKTTLLRMIAGFSAPDSGDIVIGGRSMNGVGPNRRPVNMVFQHLALFPMMNVGENVAYGLRQRGVAAGEVKRRVGEMLERVGLAGSGNKGIDQLSGGQKQRVAIARSLVLEPTLLLLDEPLGALDLKLREHMKIELKQLQAAFGTTFVYITHDHSEALVLSDRVAVMNHGVFEQVGSPQDLYYQPLTPFVASFVGNNNGFTGQVESSDGVCAVVRTADGLALQARMHQALQPGAQALLFVRPEAMVLLESGQSLARNDWAIYEAQVESLLFDGANSAVLVREPQTRTALRIALPQTGQYAGLQVGQTLRFGFDPHNAVCFGAADAR
jgi:spermidine/putrescine transport system ATP-binding protein